MGRPRERRGDFTSHEQATGGGRKSPLFLYLLPAIPSQALLQSTEGLTKKGGEVIKLTTSLY